MKKITVEVEDDEVLVALKRPDEGYDDVCPSLVAEDAMRLSSFEYRTVWPKDAP